MKSLFTKNILAALEAIEEIVSDDFCETAELELFKKRVKDKNLKVAYEKLGKIYKIAHSFNPKHSCYNYHKDWRDEIRK